MDEEQWWEAQLEDQLRWDAERDEPEQAQAFEIRNEDSLKL